MSNNPNTEQEKGQLVRQMFARIARRYDLMNRLMTGGQDIHWRKEVVRRTYISPGAYVLDLGTGTGDIAQEIIKQSIDSRVVGGDFTISMMRVGKEQPAKSRIIWVGCDALNLPFADQTFEAVVSGFLFRNVVDIHQALKEQFRVLKPGGRMVTLDTTRPPEGWTALPVRLYLRKAIPLLGRLVTGDQHAYRYLPESTAGFLSAEQLEEEILWAGFTEAGFTRKMFSTVAIHWGRRPEGM
jgi:demethylmenaquinone methyltransferase/2-methoxy-6-polyprenyl-1,4-benzoquinol methylase